MNKWAKTSTDNSPKRIIEVDLKHMKKGSVLLIIREMQIKTTLRHHFSPVRCQLGKNSKAYDYTLLARIWGNAGTLLHCILAGNAKWYNPYGEELGNIQQISFPFTLRHANLTSGH